MSVYVEQNGTKCSFNTKDSWVVLSPTEKSIKAKIESNGMPLKNWDINIYRGILTGFNEAFIVDGETKDALISADPKSAEIIRPILRGRDIRRYGYNFADLWLIATHNGIKEKGISPIDVNEYPAIKNHLDKFYTKLAKRADKGDTPYNLRNCVYMDDFSKQKIVWARLTRISKNDFSAFPRFAILPEDFHVVDSLCFFTGDNLELLVEMLNSKYAAYYFFNSVAILDNGGMQMRQQYVENIPLPKIKDWNKSLNIDDCIFDAFSFTEEEKQYINDFLKQKEQEISNMK